MSRLYGAEQYDDAFIPKRMQQYQSPKNETHARPKAPKGITFVIADNSGHILPGVPRSNENPWGNFVGTWDLPKHLPGNHVLNFTGRSKKGIDALLKEKEEADLELRAKQLPPRKPKCHNPQFNFNNTDDGECCNNASNCQERQQQSSCCKERCRGEEATSPQTNQNDGTPRSCCQCDC